jgi:hypothetical protein
MTGLVMTAYTFHIVSIFGEGGLERSRAVGVFLPAAVVAVTVEIAASYVSDYVRLKYLLSLQLGGLVLLSLSIALMQPGLVVAAAIVGQGIMHGVFGVPSTARCSAGASICSSSRVRREPTGGSDEVAYGV